MRSSFLNTPPLPRILEKRCGLMFETSILNLTPFNLHQITVDTNIAGSRFNLTDVACLKLVTLSYVVTESRFIVKCHDERKTTAFHQMIQFKVIYSL